jgi:hypothetical protein
VFGMVVFTAIAADATEPGPFVVTYLLSGLLCLACAAIIIRVPDGADEVLTGAIVVDDGEAVAVDHDQLVPRA